MIHQLMHKPNYSTQQKQHTPKLLFINDLINIQNIMFVSLSCELVWKYQYSKGWNNVNIHTGVSSSWLYLHVRHTSVCYSQDWVGGSCSGYRRSLLGSEAGRSSLCVLYSVLFSLVFFRVYSLLLFMFPCQPSVLETFLMTFLIHLVRMNISNDVFVIACSTQAIIPILQYMNEPAFKRHQLEWSVELLTQCSDQPGRYLSVSYTCM